MKILSLLYYVVSLLYGLTINPVSQFYKGFIQVHLPLQDRYMLLSHISPDYMYQAFEDLRIYFSIKLMDRSNLHA